MNIKKLAESLHQFERRVLPLISKHNFLTELAFASGLKEVEVMRALQWLQNKNAVEIFTEPKEFINLDTNGKKYCNENLPEKKFLEVLKNKDEITLTKIIEKSGLNKDEVNLCIGLLRQKGAIILLKKDKGFIIKITDEGIKKLNSEFPEEKFLRSTFPKDTTTLSKEEKQIFETLKKRKKFLITEIKKIKSAKLTSTGEKLVECGVRDDSIVDTITTEILRTGTWKNKTFRRYDVTINVPKTYGGKPQPYRFFLDSIRKKFMSLGFQEMDGPIVETEFWNMDALYMPQFHSARDIHDAYYIKKPKTAEIPQTILKKVKASHENGTGSESTGWRYSFDTEQTKKCLLRTQGTACSARKLGSENLTIPGKYFGITRVFRYDVIDATHLPDFYQTEGFVIEDNLNFRHLVGLLKMFAKEIAETEEYRIIPAYFPFTEPSAELFAKHPKLGWIELGGAGIFRPEVVKPLLGKDTGVIAWGLGIDRIGMFKLGINDIRQLFSQDLQLLKNTRLI